MKVYSWKTLIATILIAGGAIIYQVKDLMEGEKFSYFTIIFWIYLFIKGLWVSFTEDGFDHDKLNESISNKVLTNLFGRWTFIASWGGIILIVFGGISIKFIPSQKWIGILLFIIGLIYNIIAGIIVRKHIKIEKRKHLL